MAYGEPDAACSIRAAAPTDVPAIVEVHIQAFPQHFLTQLGRRFLKLLYLGFIQSGSGLCLVAVSGERIVGAAAGTTQPESFFRRLLQSRGLAFLIAGLGALLRRPGVVARRFVQALWYRGDGPAGLTSAALLSSLAVQPTSQGSGAGARLLDQFCRQCAARGAASVYLVTDAAGNDGVLNFYRRNDFSATTRMARGPRQLLLLIRHLQPSTGATARDSPVPQPRSQEKNI